MNMRCEETGKVLWQTDEWFLYVSINTFVILKYGSRSEDVFRIEQEGKLTRHSMNQVFN